MRDRCGIRRTAQWLHAYRVDRIQHPGLASIQRGIDGQLRRGVRCPRTAPGPPRRRVVPTSSFPGDFLAGPPRPVSRETTPTRWCRPIRTGSRPAARETAGAAPWCPPSPTISLGEHGPTAGSRSTAHATHRRRSRRAGTRSAAVCSGRSLAGSSPAGRGDRSAACRPGPPPAAMRRAPRFRSAA